MIRNCELWTIIAEVLPRLFQIIDGIKDDCQSSHECTRLLYIVTKTLDPHISPIEAFIKKSFRKMKAKDSALRFEFWSDFFMAGDILFCQNIFPPPEKIRTKFKIPFYSNKIQLIKLSLYLFIYIDSSPPKK